MSQKRHALAAIAVVAASVSFYSPAQAGDPGAADAVFRKGRESAERGDWASACPKFAESQRLDPAPGTLLNLADCEEHLGQLASAYEHFKTALETLAPRDDRIPFAKQHIASMEKKVPHLTLSAAQDLPSNVRVRRDDVELGSASFGLALPIDPGTHAIVVTAPGHVERKVMVTLKAGEARTIALELGDVDESAAAPAAASQTKTPEAPAPGAESRGDPKRVIGVVTGAAGLVGIGIGAVAGVLVLGKKSIVDDPSHCNQVTHACDQTGTAAASDGKTLSTVSTAGFAAGGALLAAGVIVFLTGGDGGKTAAAHAARALVAPEAYPGGAGLRISGTF